MRKCPNCSNVVQDDAIFCDQCGTRLPVAAASEQAAAVVPSAPAVPAPALVPAAPPVAAPADIVCPACGSHNLPGEAFCQNCGAKLEAPQPVAEAIVGIQATATSNVCPDCGATVSPEEEFCFACGADLKAARARASVAAQTTTQVKPAEQPVAPTGQPEVQPAPAPTREPTAATAAVVTCPTCGAQVKVGDTFCEACGAALTAEPVTGQAAKQVAPAAAPAAAPRLIVVASGVELPFAGRTEVVVGREDPYSGIFPDIDLTPHGGVEGGVSRRHLKITLVSGSYVIEDLNSTNFTLLNHQRIPAGAPQPLADGDEVTAGRVKLIFKA